MNEGDRIGTVEHEFRASVTDAGALKVSDLMAGGPLNGAEDLLQPTISYTVVFGVVQGYVEAYGEGATALKGRFELAASETGDALVSQEVAVRAAGGGTRAIFSRALPVRQLPPGTYVLRAVLTGDRGPVRTLTRAFEVAAPAVLMTSADSGAGPSTADVFLPVADTMLSRSFNKSEVAATETLQAFRERVAAPARPAFDAGVAALSSGDFAKAEGSFKSALATDAENTAVLAYLAAVFAAAGRDDQATGAWQTSLIDGSDFPQIYEWLADALMRYAPAGGGTRGARRGAHPMARRYPLRQADGHHLRDIRPGAAGRSHASALHRGAPERTRSAPARCGVDSIT